MLFSGVRGSGRKNHRRDNPRLAPSALYGAFFRQASCAQRSQAPSERGKRQGREKNDPEVNHELRFGRL